MTSQGESLLGLVVGLVLGYLLAVFAGEFIQRLAVVWLPSGALLAIVATLFGGVIVGVAVFTAMVSAFFIAFVLDA